MPEPYEPGPPTPPTPPPGRPTKEQRNWAMLAHLTGLSFFAVPFGNIVGPLLIWQIKREDLGEFVGASAREALNFQFTFIVLLVFSGTMVLLPLPGVHYFAWPMAMFFCLANVYFCCMAAIETNGGEVYRYPYSFRPF